MRQNGVRNGYRFPYGESGGMKKQGYTDRKDESIAMRVRKKRTKEHQQMNLMVDLVLQLKKAER